MLRILPWVRAGGRCDDTETNAVRVAEAEPASGDDSRRSSVVAVRFGFPPSAALRPSVARSDRDTRPGSGFGKGREGEPGSAETESLESCELFALPP
jgi:hypothetical protein